MNVVTSAFNDPEFIKMVQDRLPKLFKEARIEAETLSNIMAVGSYRKKKIINLLTGYCGHNRVKDIFSSKMYGRDIAIDNVAISIKTISNNNDVKVKWTVDSEKVALLSA